MACVAFGVLTPRAALGAIDGATLVLLLGMMGIAALLGVDGFFERAATALAARAATPARLLGWLVWGVGGLSALLTNDAVCVLATPIVVTLVARHRLPAAPFLLAIATAANTGSVATLVGNPQNMLVASLGGLDYLDHLALAGPVAVVGLAVNHALLALVYRRALAAAGDRLPTEPSPPLLTRRSAVTLGAVAVLVGLHSAGADLAAAAIGVLAVLLLVRRHDVDHVWRGVDWSILVFFGGLFVVVGGLTASGATDTLFARVPLAGGGEGALADARLAAVFLVGSNVVSNVPFILVVKSQMATLPDPRLGWELLAMASTFAGNLTLLGSVANVIVAEKGRVVGGFGFLEHLRVGLPLAVVTTALGTAWMVAVA
ncbi:MAG: hypothetical protein H6745_15300 [Deltaproteobacteria bacterium]|nr:hypothetical protein [Deltaproteobacteria bacterium]